VRRDLLAESARHTASQRLRQIPSIGPIRAALLIALLQTPHRFRSKRQLWVYSGFGIETHDSGQYRYVEGELRRAKKKASVRGLNRNYNHDLKNLFKGAATQGGGETRSLAGVLRRSAGQRNPARHGTTHVGTKAGHDHFNDLEERGGFRRPTIASASSLSVSGEQGPFHLW